MRPEVKICGLKKPADAQYVNDAVADYAGFVFYEKSRRHTRQEVLMQLWHPLTAFRASG